MLNYPLEDGCFFLTILPTLGNTADAIWRNGLAYIAISRSSSTVYTKIELNSSISPWAKLVTTNDLNFDTIKEYKCGTYNGTLLYRRLVCVTTSAVNGETTDEGIHGIVGDIKRVCLNTDGVEALSRQYIYTYADSIKVYARCLNGGVHTHIMIPLVWIEYTK